MMHLEGLKIKKLLQFNVIHTTISDLKIQDSTLVLLFL